MSTSIRVSLVLLAVVLGTAQRAAGATLTQSFDLTLVGDDPSQAITLSNPFLTDQPIEVFFQGFAENLNDAPYDDHGVLVEFTDRMSDFVVLPSRNPLTGPVQVPLSYHWTFGAAPSTMTIYFEGGGPADNIHFAGTLMRIGTVPEPSSAVLAVCGLLGALSIYHSSPREVGPSWRQARATDRRDTLRCFRLSAVRPSWRCGLGRGAGVALVSS
jgi:hypothetical protein